MKKSNWYIFLLNGLVAIFFGMLLLVTPMSTIVAWTLYFGLLVMLSGLIMFFIAYRNMKSKKSYTVMMIESILAFLIGGVIVFYPRSTWDVFLVMIGIWATMMGLLQIVMAVRMQKKVSHHSLFTINGVITLVFGLLLLINPIPTSRVLFIIIGLLAVVAGVMLLYLAVKVKGVKE